MQRDKQSVTPMTIRQLVQASKSEDAGDDSVRLDGAVLTRVRLVGCVAGVEIGTTHALLTIEDATGRANLRKWYEGDEELTAQQERIRQEIAVHSYVVVHGEVRKNHGRVDVQVLNVRPVTDFDEVTHHFLEAIFVHLQRTRGPLRPGASAAGGATGGGMLGSLGLGSAGALPVGARPMSAGGFEGFSAYSAASARTSAAVPMAVEGLEERVLAAFREAGPTDIGASIDTVAAMLAGHHITPAQVRQAVDALSLEGHLYTTVDENHFKTTS